MEDSQTTVYAFEVLNWNILVCQQLGFPPYCYGFIRVGSHIGIFLYMTHSDDTKKITELHFDESQNSVQIRDY